MGDALRLGTRGSALALAQAAGVARALEAYGTTVEIVTIRTAGDERPAPESPRGDTGQSTAGSDPAAAGTAGEDKGRFVKELEQALLGDEIDLAVHSAKDVPSELPNGLEIVAVPERADARDALCLAPALAAAGAGQASAGATGARSGEPRRSLAARPLAALPDGATVGTASLRRRAGLLALRPDLEIVALRGNVDTRLRRIAAADARPLDAIVLAAAGLARLGRSAEGAPLPELTLVPAAGQGCLALEARAGDDDARRLACRLTDPRAFACLTAERTLVSALGATCHTPIGAHATIVGHSSLELVAFAGTPDGTRWVRDDVRGLAEDPHAVGLDAANRLTAAGAREILAAAERQG